MTNSQKSYLVNALKKMKISTFFSLLVNSIALYNKKALWGLVPSTFLCLRCGSPRTGKTSSKMQQASPCIYLLGSSRSNLLTYWESYFLY